MKRHLPKAAVGSSQGFQQLCRAGVSRFCRARYQILARNSIKTLVFLATSFHASRQEAKGSEQAKRQQAHTAADFQRPCETVFASSGRLLLGADGAARSECSRRMRSQHYRLKRRMDAVDLTPIVPEASLWHQTFAKLAKREESRRSHMLQLAKVVALLKLPLARKNEHYAAQLGVSLHAIEHITPRVACFCCACLVLWISAFL